MAGSKLAFLQLINDSMQIKDNMGATRDEDATFGVYALLVNPVQFGEEGAQTESDPGANQVDAIWANDTF